MSDRDFESQVFINCPFDDKYLPLLRPLLFTVAFLGFHPRIASERFDSGESRIDKICSLVEQCTFGIHDLSRIRASEKGEYARMNLPFELGLDYSLRHFGSGKYSNKKFLILEAERYAFQKAISDLSGIDIKAHGNLPENITRAVRNWFIENGALEKAPSATEVWYRFADFTSDFYDERMAEGYSDEDLNMMPIPEYKTFIDEWVEASR